MKNFIKVFTILLVVSMLIGMTACGQQPQNEESTIANTSTGAGTDSSANASTLISDTPITLTFMVNEHPSCPIFPDALVFKEIEKKTNIKLDFQIIPDETYADKLNITIASGEIPDMMNIPVDQAKQFGEKGLFAKLNDLINGSTNIKNVITPEMWISQIAESGAIYSIPYITDVSKGMTSVLQYGWLVRKDWLNKLNMEEPKTLDEFYNMLVAFRDQIPQLTGKKEIYPLTQRWGLYQTEESLCNMFGTKRVYNIVDDKVVYTPVTDEFKEMLMYLNKLYKENLLDKEFITLGTTQWEERMTSGNAGATWDVVARADMLTPALQKADPEAELTVIAPPKGPNGQGAYTIMSAVSNPCVAISAKLKYINEAFKLYDYIFGKEGSDLMNFGVEGVTYNVVDGKYKFTDKIMNEIKNATTPVEVMSKYGIGLYNFVYDFNVEASIANGTYGPKTLEAASKISPNDFTEAIPTFSYTDEQQTRLSEIDASLSAVKDEYIAKFIMDQLSFDNWNNYIADLKKNGYEEYEQILNEGYQNYKSKLDSLKE